MATSKKKTVKKTKSMTPSTPPGGTPPGSVFSTDGRTEVRNVRLSVILRDPEFSRPLDYARVAGIVRNYRWQSIGLPKLACWDNKLYLIEGEERLESLIRLGRKFQLCEILHEPTREEAHQANVDVNGTGSRKFTPEHQFHQMRRATTGQREHDMHTILQEFGFDIRDGVADRAPYKFRRAKPLLAIYDTYGAERFRTVIASVRAGCTPLEARCLNHGTDNPYFLSGLAMFVCGCDMMPSFAGKLRVISPSLILAEAQGRMRVHGIGLVHTPVWVRDVLVSIDRNTGYEWIETREVLLRATAHVS